MTPRLGFSRLSGLLIALCIVPRPGIAQHGSATMRGRVIDKSSAAPVPAAEIILVVENRSVVSDASGNYLFTALPAGTVHFVIRAASFPTTRVIVDIARGQAIDRTIELDSTAAGRSAQDLPAVTTTAPAVSYRLVGFERRRQTGRGHYLTDDDIQRSGANTLHDAIRGLRGVSLECGGSRACRTHMVRAPMNCDPEYVVDERPNNDFGPLTPIRDIVALEVYTGPSDVPGEFAGRNAGCGVIVIWTRTGPTRSR
jgi:Carboxypeptidase regulatory-like domain